MTGKQWLANGFLFSTDKSKLNISYIHQFLSEKSYWAKGVPRNIVERSIQHSLAIGIYDATSETQMGFARLVTDYATFAYLADVFVDENYRGRGASKKLMEFIFQMEEVQGLRRIMLGTADAHGLYAKYGFKALAAPERFMEVHNREVYQKTKI